MKYNKGFTLIEAMVALFVVGIALAGLAVISGSSVRANIISHDYTVATTLAQKFIEEIRREALHWNNLGNSDFNEPDAQRLMPLLLPARAGDMPSFREATSVLYNGNPQAYTMTLRRVPPMFSGNPASAPAKFCVHYRITWVVQFEIMKAEVRVLWYKPGVPRTQVFANCGAGREEDMAQDRENINMVSMAQLIRRYIITQ